MVLSMITCPLCAQAFTLETFLSHASSHHNECSADDRQRLAKAYVDWIFHASTERRP